MQDTEELHFEEHVIVGHELYDESGHRVGRVDDVLFDERSSAPEWLVVRTGRFQLDHLVPVNRAHWVEDHLETPYEKDDIVHSPGLPHHEHVLTQKLERQLEGHYHIRLVG